MAATTQHMQGNTKKRSALVKGKKQEDDKSRDFIGMDNVHSGQGFLFSFFFFFQNL
jgi:hypothetical protein